MNEIQDIYELESDDHKLPTTTIQTQHGPVEVPLDENWQEYTEAEREIIKNAVCKDIEYDWTDTKEFFVDEEVSVRAFTILSSFKEAKEASDGAVVLEGDGGGQIYLTCPMRHVKCSEETLNKLLHEIDKLEWYCNEGWGVRTYYRRAESGDGVWGGMGGGIVEDELWIHPDICSVKTERIRNVINGESTSIFN
jgi:hypothetical protein